MKKSPASPIQFSNGMSMKNRFMLAPLTNQQSFEDGQLSEEEFNWLTKRAIGQFGIVMTCAAHVQESGKGFSGQLGIFSDIHISGHQKLTAKLREHGSLSVIQLYHGGMRSPKELIHQIPVCPSNNEKTGARAMSLTEVEELKNDFIAAAVRAKKSGYDGVEIHGAHGYIICQFLSKKINKRNDLYGGSLQNRSRLLFEIVDGVRKTCGKNFLLGVRLSPERFGMDIDEIKLVCQQLIDTHKIDFLDLSLWDYSKKPEEKKYQHTNLLDHFASLDFKQVLLTVAGKIRTAKDVNEVLNTSVDFVTIGHSAILHHDFPRKVIENPTFKSVEIPVSKEYLYKEGLSDKFIDYLKRRPGFVAGDS